ncbi:MAG TPA: zinc ribbon domain-containing protein [Roseiflexaceae bacterium]|nr:zinc ribbon domain-containing protein [Roseiflexaceae bacterium]
MPTRLDTLRAVFASPLARQAARAAPFLLVASASGAAIGAALGDPTFAASPFGTLGVSLAANMVTSMAYDLLKPDLDDDTRAEQIVQALEARDPASGALIAAALIEAGPEVAQALPETGREVLISGLEAGMRHADGALAAIAPRYTAGLRDGQTDWAALQAALRQTVEQTTMHMEVGHKGQIRNAAMEVTGAPGDVDMRMIAGDEGVIDGARMVRSGDRVPAARSERRCPDCGASVAAGLTACPRCGAPLGAA